MNHKCHVGPDLELRDDMSVNLVGLRVRRQRARRATKEARAALLRSLPLGQRDGRKAFPRMQKMSTRMPVLQGILRLAGHPNFVRLAGHPNFVSGQ